MALYECVSSGGTLSKTAIYTGATTISLTCKKAYLYAASTSNYPVVTLNNVTQTAIQTVNPSSYSHDGLYYFANLNNASIKIDKGRGIIIYI